MVTSQGMRNDYPELIASGVDSSWYLTGSPLACDYSGVTKVKFLAEGSIYTRGHVALGFHPAVAEWARALAAVMFHHQYPFRESAGGSLSCRKITGGGRTSLHAHGVAADFNPSKNRYRVSVGPFQWGKATDMTPEMIFDVEQIQTTEGLQVTQWGGRWFNVKDPMHFQPSKVTREQLASGVDFGSVPGWATYQSWIEGETVLTEGNYGWAVYRLQDALNGYIAKYATHLEPLTVDKSYGPKTTAAVQIYQSGDGLAATGNADGVTYSALMRYLPGELDSPTPAAHSHDDLAARVEDVALALENHGHDTSHDHDNRYAAYTHSHQTEGHTV